MDQRLFEASILGDVKKLDELLREDPQILQNMSMSPSAENTPLHVATLAGHVDFVRQVLEQMPSLAIDRNKNGFVPIHLATAAGNLEVVNELLRAAGAGQCLLTDNERRTAIHYAAIKGRVEIIKELLATCPEAIEQVTFIGETALLLAVKNSQFEAFQVLFDASRNHDNRHEERINAKDNKEKGILEVASASNQLQVIGIVEPTHQFNHQAIIVEEHRIPSDSSRRREANLVAKRMMDGWSDFYNDKIMPVVASLIAAATYQAAVNPPPSIWTKGVDLDPKCMEQLRYSGNKRPLTFYFQSCPAAAYYWFMGCVVVAFCSSILLIPFSGGNLFTILLMVICFVSMLASVAVSVLATTSGESETFYQFSFYVLFFCGTSLVYVPLLRKLIFNRPINLWVRWRPSFVLQRWW